MSKLLLFERSVIRPSKAVLLLLFLILSSRVSAQEHTITGKITDETGAPLPGVSILIKGSTQGTSSDSDGAYTLPVPDGATVVASFIGYTSQEIAVEGKSQINITMLPDVTSLQEVVVIGYGESSKAKITGAVATVESTVFERRNSLPNPMAALQGQIPGVIVTRSTGAPGREGWDFQIRGASSVNSSQPLVIVDGIPLVNNTSLNTINPNDIENLTVLKDASAAAIYGSRAAGGVVLITTKKAKSGKPTIQYDGSVSRKVLGLKPNLITADQWGPSLKTAIENNNVITSDLNWLWYRYALSYIDRPASGYVDLTTQPNTIGFGDVKDFTYFDTDWQDVLWGNATTTQHNLSLSARTDKMGYRLSLGLMDEGSPLKWGKNSNSRYNARLSHDYTFSDKLRMETIISVEKNDIIQPTRIGSVYQFSQPGFPVATVNGKPYGWGTQYTPNWLVKLGGENKEYNTKLFTTVKTIYDFTEHLSFTGQASYNWNLTDIKEHQKAITEWYNYAETALSSAPNPAQDQGGYTRAMIKDVYYNLNAYFAYSNTFASDHEMGITLGTSYERDEYNTFSTRTRYLANDDVPSLGLGLGDNTTRTNGEVQTHYGIASYFGRLSYGFKNKYLLDANARYDGASNFIAENRWKMFYGVSAGWRVTEEKFMKDVTFMNELKLRASWGSVGNSAIPRPGENSVIGLYDYIQLQDVTSTGGPTSNGFPILGTSPAVLVRPSGQLISPERTWERIETLNVGIDFSVMNNRLSGSFDYYVKNNRNMLLGQTYAGVLGATAPALNIGHLRVNGWELGIGWQDQIGEVTYSVGGTLTDNKNELVSFGGANVIPRGMGNVEGYPINSFFGLEYAGRIQDDETRTAYNALAPNNNIDMPLTGLRLGDNMFVDQNGDGKLTQPEDLVYLGRNDPRYAFGLNLSVGWKGFDFSAVFQGVGQRTIFRDGTWRVPFGSIFQGQTDHWYGKTWTPENRDAHYPLLSVGTPGNPNFNNYNYQISDWSVENGAYVRLKNVVLGYTLPAQLTQRAKIEKLRVYVSGSDLWESLKIRDGWDPEQSRTISGGFQRYPFYRLMTVGINLTF